MAEQKQPMHGKRDHQKLKSYIVLDYLMKNSDEEHTIPAKDIIDYLQLACGIETERRSIYRDIDEINKVLYMLENECSIQEAEETIDDPEYGEDEKFIVYDASRKGFYVRQRRYSADDIRFLVECVYAAKFIDEKRANRLAEVAASLVSQPQAESILHDSFLVDRVKTANTAIYYSISTINQAMSRGSREARHTPEKISFKYQKYSIQDVTKTVDRRKGELYKVSPYKLLINDGNYYLLAFDDRYQEMRTYRVDRMKAVSPTGEPRDGEDAFAALDLQNYTQRVFGMISGERHYITIRCINPLLDTMIERFGTKNAHYSKVDGDHFSVITEVELSDQFFSWLCGFGNKVKIMDPAIAEKFTAYLDKIRSLYRK